MDFEDIGANLPFILGVVVLILIQFFLKRRRTPESSHQEIVQNLLAEVRLDLRLTDLFTFNQRNKKFMTTTWELNKDKLDFLNQSTQVSLSDAFTMAKDFNEQISAAKKFKSTSYLISIDVDKLKGPLTDSQHGLEQWLMSEVGTTEPQTKIPGVFDDLLGGR
ncbi:hypothetical protein ACFLU1_03695 [Chloroflexota bacterium]